MSDELVLKGLAVSAGIAIGPAFILDSARLHVPEYAIKADGVAEETLRFQDSVTKSLRQIKRIKSKAENLPADAAEEMNILLDAHIAMLSGSRLIRGVEKRIASEKINADAALQHEIAHLAQSFASMDDAYLASRMKDIQEVGQRLLRNLQTENADFTINIPEGSVLVAEDITPADTAQINPEAVQGFVAELGGVDGHTAIMARALDLPSVLGAAGLKLHCKDGTMIAVDGLEGEIIINPSAATLARLRKAQLKFKKEREQLKTLKRLPAITSDGAEVMLMANLELPRELTKALDAGAQGVGLFRTEFMFMNRKTLPDEEEQFIALRGMVEGLKGRVMTIRTLDLGGEKLSSALGDVHGESTNPALGLRAIRLCLKQPKLFETQLAAILRAAVYGPVRILLPMISSVEQVKQVREKVHLVAKRLQRRGEELPDPLPPVGVMIEIPGAALAADALAQVSDFFSIGSNDLTQYTLAIDRSDEQVADLYNPLHPAVLRLIQFSTEAALRARIPISLCGEMAGNPQLAAFLIGIGIRELSMSPPRLPEVKRTIRGLSLLESTRHAAKIMSSSDETLIKQEMANKQV
ncbi:MAG: phosphoenolpyruvate--protein phosphotransferase [Alphaproteobacteria bacterium]|nr:phosphoenolpyruvate--protein phosphotransferase [Alphaproteobacteria bacterium]